MRRSVAAASPDAYVAALTGWRRACVTELREGETIGPATVRRLTTDAVELNERVGDPTRVARPT